MNMALGACSYCGAQGDCFQGDFQGDDLLICLACARVFANVIADERGRGSSPLTTTDRACAFCHQTVAPAYAISGQPAVCTNCLADVETELTHWPAEQAVENNMETRLDILNRYKNASDQAMAGQAALKQLRQLAAEIFNGEQVDYKLKWITSDCAMIGIYQGSGMNMRIHYAVAVRSAASRQWSLVRTYYIAFPHGHRRCRNCGYDLFASSGAACPECGKVIFAG